MDYAIFSTDGNLLGTYESRSDAFASMNRMVEREPAAAFGMAMLTLDDGGMAVGLAVYPPLPQTTVSGATGASVAFATEGVTEFFAGDSYDWEPAPGGRTERLPVAA
jgi:hypothetical protein